MGAANTGTLHHTAFIVNDIEKSARALADSLSVQWSLWTIEPVASTVHGQDVPFTFRAAIAQVGDSNLELVAPHTGESVYVEHLKTRGEGFHHTCVAYPSFDAMNAARDELLAQGRTMIQSASLGDTGAFYYFDMIATGAVLELLYLKELLPPEKTIG